MMFQLLETLIQSRIHLRRRRRQIANRRRRRQQQPST
jgi:hypothetical protein